MGVKQPQAADQSKGKKWWLGNNWQLRWTWAGYNSDNMFQWNITNLPPLFPTWHISSSTKAEQYIPWLFVSWFFFSFLLAASLRFPHVLGWQSGHLPEWIWGLRRNMNSKNNDPSVGWCLKTDLELIHTWKKQKTKNNNQKTGKLNPNVD